MPAASSSWLFALIPVGAVVSYIITLLYRRFALSKLILDVPGERSSHSTPTPRGGGIAIVITVIGSLLILRALDFLSYSFGLALTGAGIAIAMVGLVDDIRPVNAGLRLLVHFIAGVWALYWLGGVPPLVLAGHSFELGIVGDLCGLLFIVWMINLYNFMDGIDGIASIEAISVCLGGIVLVFLSGTGEEDWLVLAVLMSSVAGFLLWNFPKAKIFLGDIGSGFLGVVIALIALQHAWIKPDLFWSFLILLGVFIVDATLTLLRRLQRGQRVYEPHRSHAYQVASRRYGSHVRVSLAVGALNLFWLLPVAIAVMLGWVDGLTGLLVSYIPLVWVANRYGAGIDNG